MAKWQLQQHDGSPPLCMCVCVISVAIPKGGWCCHDHHFVFLIVHVNANRLLLPVGSYNLLSDKRLGISFLDPLPLRYTGITIHNFQPECLLTIISSS